MASGTDPRTRELLRLIHQTVFMFDRAADHQLRERSLGTFPQFLIMTAIDRFPGLTQQKIAAFLHVTPAAVSRMLDTLVEAGYVSRTDKLGSRRAHAVALTAAGRRRFERMDALVSSQAAIVTATVPRAELEATLRTLHALHETVAEACVPHHG
ncbi:MAG TPA: MarR family transcriptional regulator [Candidatus Paceibacterota bacterium]|nr:MarR family transcriptional regulator [Candidatus Paceibacterota bacterium]